MFFFLEKSKFIKKKNDVIVTDPSDYSFSIKKSQIHIEQSNIQIKKSLIQIKKSLIHIKQSDIQI